MLVGLPTGVINSGTVWIVALVPYFFKNSRVYVGLGLAVVPLIGTILLMTLPAKGAEWGIVVSTWLAGTSASLFCASASILTSNVKGNTKKSVVSAAYFIFFCLGSVVSPQAWTQDDAPRYTKGCILSISSLVCFMITLVVYAVMAKRESCHRDRMAAEGHVEYMVMSGNSGEVVGVSLDSDLTDGRDKAFRYTL